MPTILTWIALITGIIGIVSGVTALIVWIFKKGEKSGFTVAEKTQMTTNITNIQTDLTKILERLGKVEECTHDLKTKIEPWWNLINTNLPKLLDLSHSENYITRLVEDRITDEELEHLEQEVEELLIEDKNTSGKIMLDLMALWIIKVKKSERKNGKSSSTACGDILPNTGGVK